MSVVNACNGLALMFNALVNPIAIAAIGWKYYIVYCVLLVIAVIVAFLLFPETRGHSLEEISTVFDGDRWAWQRVTPSFIQGEAGSREDDPGTPSKMKPSVELQAVERI